MYTDFVDSDDPSRVFTDDPLGLYIHLVRTTVPPLQEGEADDLLRRVRAGDEASKKRLVEANLHLVLPIAERYRSSGLHKLQLIEKGNDGLIRAVQTFAGASATDLRAYVNECIEQAISAAAEAGPIARSFPHLPKS